MKDAALRASTRTKPLAGLCAALLLAGCASHPERPAAQDTRATATPAAAPASAAAAASPGTSAAASPRNGNGNGNGNKKFSDAVVAPLADLNLVREPIPPVLATAQKAPYAFPADKSCNGLAAEIAALDAELDPDADVVANGADPTMMDRGAVAATDAVIGAVRSTTEGVIPFRGWVRKLTGADRYAKEVSAAVTAGIIRRAYLKGLGKAGGCLPPAAPWVEVPRAAASAPK